MDKKPRFFCDNCGYEVGNNAKSCPHCGRFFSSVRCPSCGFYGQDKLFLHGCPACGYSAPPGETRGDAPAEKSPVAKAYIIGIIVLLVIIMILAFIITR